MTPEQVMKACQVGCHNLNAANDLLAQCYGTIGKLLIDLQAARAEPEREVEPVAWMTCARVFGEGFTTDRRQAEKWMKSYPSKTTSLYTAPQPAEQQTTPDVAALVEALEWYSEQVLGCRKTTSEGEQYRTALDRDGGARAREALAAYRKGGRP